MHTGVLTMRPRQPHLIRRTIYQKIRNEFLIRVPSPDGTYIAGKTQGTRHRSDGRVALFNQAYVSVTVMKRAWALRLNHAQIATGPQRSPPIEQIRNVVHFQISLLMRSTDMLHCIHLYD